MRVEPGIYCMFKGEEYQYFQGHELADLRVEGWTDFAGQEPAEEPVGETPDPEHGNDDDHGRPDKDDED